MIATQPLELRAPLSGVLLALDKVPDPVFASRMIGDGLCIDPTSQTLCAPLAGVISNIQDTGHAVSITDDNGVQVLMHIGLDTVSLAGKGFTRLVEEGQRVEAGQALIEFDADYVALNARSVLTLMLVVSGEPFTLLASGLVELGQPVLQVAPGNRIEEADEEEGDALFSKPLTLPNANGLHARPAAVLAQAAKAFSASIYLHKQTQSANAKSLVAIMALQTVQGDSVQVSAAGEDAEAAIAALVALLTQGCGEAVTTPTAVLPATLLRGVCASPGAAFGQVFQVAEPVLNITEQGAGQAVEQAALARGLVAATQALQALQDDAVGSAQAEIFRAHQELLEDPTLLEQAHGLLAEGKSAAFAWNRATAATVELFQGLGNALIAERAADLADVGQRVLKLILGIQDSAWDLPERAILIAEQLTPSQTASLDTRKVLGFVTVGGGATSHVAILARALGLPAICGVSPEVLALANARFVLLDADQGTLQLDPDLAQIEQLETARAQQLLRHQRDMAQAGVPAITAMGIMSKSPPTLLRCRKWSSPWAWAAKASACCVRNFSTWTATAPPAPTNKPPPTPPSPVPWAPSATWWCAPWMSAVTNLWPMCRWRPRTTHSSVCAAFAYAWSGRNCCANSSARSSPAPVSRGCISCCRWSACSLSCTWLGGFFKKKQRRSGS